MPTRFGVGALALCLVATASSAAEPRKLEGEYWIGSKTILDPPANEKKDRVYLSITGKAARDIYSAMPGKGRQDECVQEPLRFKEAGGLVCVKNRDEVHCSVAITLAQGRAVPGAVC